MLPGPGAEVGWLRALGRRGGHVSAADVRARGRTRGDVDPGPTVSSRPVRRRVPSRVGAAGPCAIDPGAPGPAARRLTDSDSLCSWNCTSRDARGTGAPASRAQGAAAAGGFGSARRGSRVVNEGGGWMPHRALQPSADAFSAARRPRTPSARSPRGPPAALDPRSVGIQPASAQRARAQSRYGDRSARTSASANDDVRVRSSASAISRFASGSERLGR